MDPAFEHGLLVDHGDIQLADTPLHPAELGYLAPGATILTLTNTSDQPARAVLIGGPPFEEQIVMWWNFIAGDSSEIVQAREDWEKGVRFGEVQGYDGERLPAPELPKVALKPRGNVR